MNDTEQKKLLNQRSKLAKRHTAIMNCVALFGQVRFFSSYLAPKKVPFLYKRKILYDIFILLYIVATFRM